MNDLPDAHGRLDETDVRCSCGKVAVLWFDPQGFGRCDDPAWEYHAHPRDDRKSRLWHCGDPKHYQAGLRKHDPERDG